MKKLLIVFLFCLLLSPSVLYAAFENIALIEDTDGSINSSVAIGNTYLSKASCAFFKKYPQNFDVILFFTTYKTTMFGTPEGWAVKRNIKGIGFDMPTDQSSKYCSANGRLRHAIKLADIAVWPDNPEDAYTGAIGGVYNGLEVIGHEVGHLWLVGAKYKDENGSHCTLRALMPDAQPSGGECDGYKDSDFHIHYSYYFDSRSVMFGSFIEDLGGGQFRFYNEKRGFSPLDQYFMGLRDKSEVPEMLLVNTGNISDSSNTPLKKGETKTISGKGVKVNIGQIIAALGDREPATEPCHMKMAFAVIYPKGQVPSHAVLQKAENYRVKFEEYYIWATSNRGSVDTTLDGSGKGSSFCPAPLSDAGYSDISYTDTNYTDISLTDVNYDISTDSFITDVSSDTYVSDISETKDVVLTDTEASDTGADVPVREDGMITEDIFIEEDAIEEDITAVKDTAKEKAETDSGCSCNLLF